MIEVFKFGESFFLETLTIVVLQLIWVNEVYMSRDKLLT